SSSTIESAPPDTANTNLPAAGQRTRFCMAQSYSTVRHNTCMQEFFGVLAGVLSLVSGIPYIRDILAGKTKPHRGSFLIWTVLGLIAFITQFAAGATWSLVLPVLDTLLIAAILALSIERGSGGVNRRDATGLALAAGGLVLWYFTKQPLTALLVTIGIDA